MVELLYTNVELPLQHATLTANNMQRNYTATALVLCPVLLMSKVFPPIVASPRSGFGALKHELRWYHNFELSTLAQ